MLPSYAEWQDLYRGLKSKTGLDLNQYKQDQLQRRIVNMAETKKFIKLGEFWNYVSSSPDNLQWFLDKLAINVTEMFRNPEKWDELQNKVLPELLKNSSNLKCWSAGCSIGAEAHTLAMILDKYYNGKHTVEGTDIDDAALKQAKSGIFSAADVRSAPQDLVKQYLKPTADGNFAADSRLQKYLSFRKQNLLADSFGKDYDLILCRNVVIYFNDEAKDKLYKRFYQALKPGGILFVGSTERIFGARDMGFECPIAFFYRKPLKEETIWRNAS